jgi:hypothetical protein
VNYAIKPVSKTVRPIKDYFIFVALCAVLASCSTATISKHDPNAPPQIVFVKKIWDHGGHNAFTDLIYFKDQWFCTFRESVSHVAGEGKIRVLSSTDGENWQPAALLTEQGVDLRDPKFSITPDNRLMLNCVGAHHVSPKVVKHQSCVAFSNDGHDWTNPQHILDTNDWLWRVTWHDHKAYGVVYRASGSKDGVNGANQWSARFVESEDGIQFRTVTSFEIPNRPNEATARFLENGDCVVLIRREAGDKTAWIGISAAPYTSWQWKPAGLFVGGPNFLILKDGSMVVSGREMNAAPVGAKTFVGTMDIHSVTPTLILPSGGDCSYPGLVWRDGFLWESYYSSHQGKTSIYLAKIKL